MFGKPVLRQINNPAANNTVKGVSAEVPGVPADPASAPGFPRLFVSIYSGTQIHYTYIDNPGNIWDVFWDRDTQNFSLQQIINHEGETLAAAAGPFVGVYGNQQHFVWVSGGNPFSGDPDVGTIWDSWYDGSWHFQRINKATTPTNFPGVYTATSGPQAASGPSLFEAPGIQGPYFNVVIWNWLNQQHFTYEDVTGTVWDAFWDGNQWQPPQQINQARTSTTPPPPPPQGNTGAPLALGDPYVDVFQPIATINPQQHIAYRDFHAIIWDCWFDPAKLGHSNPWTSQHINVGRGTPPSGPGPRTQAPAALLGPFVWNNGKQEHFTYLGDSEILWDAWYDGPSNNWDSHQINFGALGGETNPKNTPGAAGVPAAATWGSDYYNFNTEHIVYRDLKGGIRDIWRDVTKDTNPWQADLLNMGGVFGDVPSAAGDPFVWTYYDQYVFDIHFTFRDGKGTIWDMSYTMDQPIEGRG